jgi:hypothetical protein
VRGAGELADLPVVEFTRRGLFERQAPPAVGRSLASYAHAIEDELDAFRPDLVLLGNANLAACYLMNAAAVARGIPTLALQTSFILDKYIVNTTGRSWDEHFAQCRLDPSQRLPLSAVRFRGGAPFSGRPLARTLASKAQGYVERVLRSLPGASGVDTWKSLASPIWLRLRRPTWFPKIPSLHNLEQIPQGCLLVALHQPFARANVPRWQDLLHYALRCAPPNLPIVIRPHPAEWPPAGANDEFGATLENRQIFISRAGFGPLLTALFEHSRAVLTISSAVGAEALTQGVPVLTLADAFYCRTGCGRRVGTRDVDNLRQALASDTLVRPDERQVESMVATMVAHHMIDDPSQSGRGMRQLVDRIESTLAATSERRMSLSAAQPARLAERVPVPDMDGARLHQSQH